MRRHSLRRLARTALWAAWSLGLGALPAGAVLDVENRGPTLDAGAFAMRVTNVGALGNPFYSVGRSFDPSFEYPRGSGQMLLNEALLWVGARSADGEVRVSGGPLLEWRPTLAPDDRVRIAYAGDLGRRRGFDDDGDGVADEEFLDGKDDDGDGEADEDLGLLGTQQLCATYRDDQPEAIEYFYPNGEQHVPLQLEVKQSAFAWSIPGYEGFAGVHFRVTNRGTRDLTDVWLGLLADLDTRLAGDSGGHLDDAAIQQSYQAFFNDGYSSVPSVSLLLPGSSPGPWYKECLSSASGRCPAVREARVGTGRPAIAVVPMWHTTDPLAWLPATNRVSESIVRPYYSAPAKVGFRSQWFANDLPPLDGGLPIVDADRYRALAGNYPTVRDTLRAHDYVSLVSCGPFPRLAPGQSVEFELALVAAPEESLRTAVERAIQLHHGAWVNALPDAPFVTWREWNVGRSGVTGHETCFEPPPGLVLEFDPHCTSKYAPDPVASAETAVIYESGRCIWTDLDCDACTGFDGNETWARWRDPRATPVPPSWRAVPGQHEVRVEWDDRSEALLDAGVTGGSGLTFWGYNLYRLDNWRNRTSDLPIPSRFQQVASFARDTALGAHPLSSAVDSSVAYDRILYERKVHPIGRYRWVDTRALDGFDYVYAVTAVAERRYPFSDSVIIVERFESPIVATIDSIVSPSVASATPGSTVWVAPNPFRGGSPWDRPPVPGDTFARHLDFLGLPHGRSTIRIYTLAGDLVQTLDHDGRNGSGQARWDLISRNGQEVASGVYLFTVEADGTHQTGKFVILR